MKRVVIEKPVETVIDLNDVTEEQIIVGYYAKERTWDKLSRCFGIGHSFYQWCDLNTTNRFVGNKAKSLEEIIDYYFKSGEENEVYVFDTFEQFLEEFPALVKSKK